MCPLRWVPGSIDIDIQVSFIDIDIQVSFKWVPGSIDIDIQVSFKVGAWLY